MVKECSLFVKCAIDCAINEYTQATPYNGCVTSKTYPCIQYLIDIVIICMYMFISSCTGMQKKIVTTNNFKKKDFTKNCQTSMGALSLSM